MDKMKQLMSAFRNIAHSCARRDGLRGSACDIVGVDWNRGRYHLPGLEVSVYPSVDDACTLEVLAREDGKLLEIEDTALAILVDYERILIEVANADQRDPAVVKVRYLLVQAAKIEADRLASDLLELMEADDEH